MILSIIMITYNHSKYIKQAIESILMQETTFDFELIITNDFSPDNTEEIINTIITEHPKGNKIKYISHPKNLGMMPNFIFSLKQGSGKYIALCEGDDYWTDPLKLQKQVDFLEKNEDFSICFHNVNTLCAGVLKEENIKKTIPEISGIKELAKANFIHNLSVVYRNGLIPEFPEYFKKAPIGDYFLHMLNARHGKIKYIDEVMGVYRIHETSYWSSKKQIEQELILVNFITNIKENFTVEIQKKLTKQVLKIKYKNQKGLKRILAKLKYNLYF